MIVSNTLKELGGIYKKGGRNIDKDWMYFVDMHTMTGYVDPKTPIDLDDEAKSWVVGKRIYNERMTQNRSMRHRILDRLLLRSRGRKVKRLSLREFLTNPTLYATSGSGRGLPKLEIDAEFWNQKLNKWESGKYKLGSTKWAGLLASTPDDLIKMVFRREKQKNFMFIKIDEKGGLKLRSIVTGDLAVYLRMAYLNYYVEGALNDCEFLPTTWSTKKRVEYMRNSLILSNDVNIIHIPIDQSAFDKNVSLDLVLDVVSWLCNLALKVSNFLPDVQDVADILYWSMDGGELIVESTGHIFEIERGVLSGWLWTSLIDSLANYIQFTEITEAMFINEEAIAVHYHQGDDIDVGTYSYEVAVAIYEGYNHYGLEINPLKFWIERDRNEFLRLVYTDNVRGYLARLVTGILYLKPGPPKPLDESWFTMLDSWKKAISRGADSIVIERMVIEEARRIFNISTKVASDLLYTPRSYGGGGWGSRWPDKFYYIFHDKPNKAKVLSNDAPLFQDYSPNERGLLLNEYLAAGLPNPKPRIKEFSQKHIVLKMKQLFINKFNLTELNFDTKLPAPIWNYDLMPTQITLNIAKFVSKEISLEDLLLFTNNSIEVKKQFNMLGRRNFIKWLKGGLIAVPLSITNPIMLVLGVHYIARQKWYLLKTLTLSEFQAYIEKYVQATMEYQYSYSSLIYGH